jgi:hypothetical protein
MVYRLFPLNRFYIGKIKLQRMVLDGFSFYRGTAIGGNYLFDS